MKKEDRNLYLKSVWRLAHLRKCREHKSLKRWGKESRRTATSKNRVEGKLEHRKTLGGSER